MHNSVIILVEVFPGIRTVRIADVEADGAVGETEVYLLECEEGLILVDVGFTPECHENIQAELDSMGKHWRDIKMIIITHAHGDHINNLPQVKKLTGAEVLIGDGDEVALEKRTGIPADIILDTGDIIGACGNIEVICVPGHTDGNLCLLLHKYKALIAGDTIIGDNTDSIHIFPPYGYSTDTGAAVNNLKLLMDIDFDALLVSHGRNVFSGAKSIVKEMLVREKII